MGLSKLEKSQAKDSLIHHYGKDVADEFFRSINDPKKDSQESRQSLADEKILMESFCLKPCPFCGTTPTKEDLIEHGNGEDYFLSCECGASSPIRDTRMEALEAWNERTNSMSLNRLKKTLAESESLSWDDFLEFEDGSSTISKDQIVSIIRDWLNFKETVIKLSVL